MAPRSSKAETERRIERAAVLLVEQAGERLYALASLLMEEFGVGRRQAFRYLLTARDRASLGRSGAVADLANAWPSMIGRLWRECEAKGDRRSRAHLARTLRDVLPADAAGPAGDEQPDSIEFSIVRPAADAAG